MDLRQIIAHTAHGIEALGVLVIVVGTIFSLYEFIFSLQKSETRSYKLLRQELGKAILLGLEILVAGDIIATVVTEPTMEKVLVLAIIVLIRTFLSFSIELEVEGRLPWHREAHESRLDQDS